MYRKSELPSTPPENFELPFEGKLSQDNRWVIMANLIPWSEFERYVRFMSKHKCFEYVRSLSCLIIDEVSMMRPDLFIQADYLLRKVRNNLYKPFGGLQLILVGDFFQLPPIINTQYYELINKNSIIVLDN